MSKVRGVQETIAKLARFTTKMRRTEMRRAGNEGSKIALAALKRTAPKQTGTWRKSLGRKVQVKGAGLRLWYGAGPRSAMFAWVTFDPKTGTAKVQGQERRRRDGRTETRSRGKERSVRLTDMSRSVRPIRKSKKLPDGTLAWFWKDKSGKVRAMPLKRKYWPVLYSHLAEKGTRQGGKAHRMIARAQAASRQAQVDAVVRVLAAAVKEV